MKIFLLDLWHDLQAKRLWPVAAVLLLGLLAVPVLLAKPAEDPAPAPVPQVQASQADSKKLAALAQVKLGEEKVAAGSTLGVFDPDNPFKPPKGAIKKQVASSGTTADAGPGSAATPDAGANSGGSGGDSGSGGGTGTGGTPDGGDGDGGKTTTTAYKYVADVTLVANGRTRRIKGLEKLDMLPSENAPLLIFMGVTAKGSDAVFLVDSTLEAAGEGRCKPSPEECAFAYIGPGAEYIFTEQDGNTYTLRVDEIRKVKVDAGGTAAGAKARASVGPHRRFAPPLIADLVIEASETLANSNSDTDSR